MIYEINLTLKTINCVNVLKSVLKTDDIPLNGMDVILKWCNSDIKIHEKIYKYINKGLTIHYVVYNKICTWSHGDPECSGILQPNIIDKIKNNKGYFEIICPHVDIIPLNENNQDKKIVIFLDVDGVINMVCAPLDKEYKKIDIYGGHGNKIFHIKYRDEVCDAIKKWGVDVQILWLTSWGIRARYRLAPMIGLPDFTNALCSKQTIDEYVYANCQGKAIIWIDDELNDTYGYLDTKKKLVKICELNNIKQICVSPNTDDGLTDDEITIINKFINDNK